MCYLESHVWSWYNCVSFECSAVRVSVGDLKYPEMWSSRVMTEGVSNLSWVVLRSLKHGGWAPFGCSKNITARKAQRNYCIVYQFFSPGLRLLGVREASQQELDTWSSNWIKDCGRGRGGALLSHTSVAHIRTRAFQLPFNLHTSIIKTHLRTHSHATYYMQTHLD